MKLNAECSLCGTSYTTFKKLKRHFKKKHADLEVFQCYFCDYMTHEKIMFKQHKEMLHPDKKFVCRKCGFKTRKWERIERHFDKHSTKLTAELPSPKNLNSSLRVKETVHAIVDEFVQLHETEKKCFQCEYCEKRFTNNYLFTNHLKVDHFQDLPFKCAVCNSACKEKKSLTRHMKTIHSDDRPFKCSICDYAAKQRKTLTAHMRVHTDERPFICQLCDFKFRYETSLKVHMKFHFNLREFACEVCDHKAYTKQFLQRHMRTHTGERPYRCHVCEKAFTMKDHLKKHLERVHLTHMN